MSISPPRAGRIDQSFRHICTAISREGSEVDATYSPKPVDSSVAVNIPCNLQEMTTARSTLYKTETDATRYDLYLSVGMGTTPDLSAATVGWNFTIGGVVYTALGKGLLMGTSGKVRIPVEGRNP